MGNLTKRFKDDGSVTYYADYLDPRSGKRVQKSMRTGDLKVAKLRLRDCELATSDSAPNETESLDEALTYFVDIVCATKASETVKFYKQKARHLSTAMGSTPVDQISNEVIERYIAARVAAGAHQHSIFKELIALRGALKSARKRGKLTGDIGDIVPKISSGYAPRETFLTSEQFEALSTNLIEVRPNAKPSTLERERVRRINRTLYLLLGALAACRKGELLKLRWEMIDLDRNLIVVLKSKVRAGGKPNRVMPIHPVLRPWLEALHQGTGLVLEPWGSIGRDLPLACLRAGVPKITLNDLRRTFASWSVQQGTPAKVIAEMMGHSSTRMVDQIYGRVGPSDFEAAMARLPGGKPSNQLHAGYTNAAETRGTDGTGGTSIAKAAITNTLENSSTSTTILVPGDGVEPPTRGFSVPFTDGVENAVSVGSAGTYRTKLRLVK